MLKTSFKRLVNHIVDVTPAQMGKCRKISDRTDIFYLVENGSGKYNELKELIEYKVMYSRERGYTCTCRSGQEAFKNVTKHESGVCWHVRAVVCCILEERAYMEALKTKEAEREEIRRNAEAQAQQEPTEQPAGAQEPPRPRRKKKEKATAIA